MSSEHISSRMARIIVDFEEMHEQEYLFYYNKDHRKHDDVFYKKMKELFSLHKTLNANPQDLFEIAVLKELKDYIDKQANTDLPCLEFYETNFLGHLIGRPNYRIEKPYQVFVRKFERVHYKEDRIYGVREVSTRANAFRFGNMYYIPRFKSLFKQEDINGEIDFFIERGEIDLWR